MSDNITLLGVNINSSGLNGKYSATWHANSITIKKENAQEIITAGIFNQSYLLDYYGVIGFFKKNDTTDEVSAILWFDRTTGVLSNISKYDEAFSPLLIENGSSNFKVTKFKFLKGSGIFPISVNGSTYTLFNINSSNNPSLISSAVPNGLYRAFILVLDKFGNNQAEFKDVEVSAEGLIITSPNGGQIWARGTNQTIRWNFSGNLGSRVKIELLKNGKLNRIINQSVPTGSNGSGSYKWLINSTQILGSDYKIRINTTTNPAYTDTSNNDFTIGGINVFSPNGGENWARGSNPTIRWNYSGSPESYVKIELLKNGKFNHTIKSNISIGRNGSGSYKWNISLAQAPGKDYKIRITSTKNPAYTDTSNNNFTISESVTVIPFGVLVDLSSSTLSKYGWDIKNATEIARDDINIYLVNKNESYRVELYFEDTRADPSEALNKTQALYGRGVRQIIGPMTSGAFINILNFINSSGIIIASPSSTAPPEWLGIRKPEEKRYAFRFISNDTFEAKAVAKVAESLGIRAVVIIYSNNSYGRMMNRSVTEGLDKYGIKVNRTISYPEPPPSDFTPYIRSLEDAVKGLGNQYKDSEIAVVSISFQELSTILEQLSNDSILLRTAWLGCGDDSVYEHPEIANRVKLYDQMYESHGAGYEGFNKNFSDLYGRTPGQFSPNAYDALWISAMANIVNHSSEFNADEIARNMPQVAKNYSKGQFVEPVSGSIIFDNFNDRISGNYSIYSIINNKAERIGVWDIETGILLWFGHVQNINKSINYTTIQAAIDDADPGDEIHVDSGTYYENVNVTKRLILRGFDTGGGRPAVNANGKGSAIILSAERSTLEGFDATNGSYAGINVKSSNNLIKNNNAMENSYGIYLSFYGNNTLTSNKANKNAHGIWIESSFYNRLEKNVAENNTGEERPPFPTGIRLLNSSHNIIEGNKASGNYVGFAFVASHYNEAISNLADRNYYGIGIGTQGNISTENTIISNTISNNYYGVYSGFTKVSFNNMIYHNNILNNTIQSYDNGTNSWNTSYPGGGNFWIDYAGADNFSGPYQNIPGSDGIGDTPYDIGGGAGAKDGYPYMRLNGWMMDVQPPASVTNLRNRSYATTYINWTWKDPQDADLAKVMVYIDGKFKANVLKGKKFFNATGFLPNTKHTISTRTVDTSGNINLTWKNHTAWTKKDTTRPASITNLRNISYATDFINWTWKDPSTPDFSYVRVYIDGEFNTTVPKGKQFFKAIGFSSKTLHNISTRTVDTSGNVNMTWRNHSAWTK